MNTQGKGVYAHGARHTDIHFRLGCGIGGWWEDVKSLDQIFPGLAGLVCV